ncbi:XRN 5'-3' exonuclease N-terminus family protein [Babesia bovis T2Bo]|uniref:5'-3' exoribonuclease (XRN2), putative n=1 Tax=Babesia bovis TaxID=5865 RepID=A7AUQ3_BABBO|nr:XRN 5'-3' exonuclease N-terminus family protein [Babesia bovis T2Bo]EDO06664.1 XRN 5'-3' exonuclease N-terminus family protein [Babesia bovis T2Bo]|eukprot:XP_001610232.1 5'-3' exoribonuclease (XRN2) [Babesia bovis T2Bo]
MGVPGFFKWLAQRYPLICETYRGSVAEKDDAFRLLKSIERSDDQYETSSVPDGFDNLYLDVNGIIHNCSHSIEELSQGLRCEEDIFVLIFQYINNLVKIVRPRKLLYLAIDGVAPRAKIMQQRDRRFRSARDSNKNEVVFQTIQENNGIEKEPSDGDGDVNFKFDPIQITPGTPFMERLSVRLRFFAHMMIHENKAWKNLKIVVSGSDVPGEGEHKIMEYIRNDKSNRHDAARAGGTPQYISHCIYGLDADLIMLSLATHEPYVCLLREQVYFFNKQTNSRMMMNMNDYIFLHIGILREYILHDMVISPELRRQPRTIDRVVDDFVLMSMFMGNDFLPHGKFAKITDGGLNTYITLYSRYLEERYRSSPNGHIWLVTGCGEINCTNLLHFLNMLVKRESSRITDELHCGPDAGRGEAKRNGKSGKTEITVIDVANCCIMTDPSEFRAKYEGKPKSFAEWRSRYYMAKMGIASDVIVHKSTKSSDTESSPCTIPEVVRDYLEGIQWVMYYYYRGVPSWNWYLRCKYAPLLSDVRFFIQRMKQSYDRGGNRPRDCPANATTLSQVMQLKFEISEPVTPFQQLMMVMPPAAAHFLPTVFGNLMTDTESPLRKYYPEHFDIDMDDTNVQWGGVTLLPIVPPNLLLRLMNGALMSKGDEKFVVGPSGKLCYMESTKLTEDEKMRNCTGVARIYYHNADGKGTTIESPMETFTSIVNCQTTYSTFFNPTLKRGQTFPIELMMYNHELQKGYHAPSERGHNIWFPSLNSLPFEPYKRGGVQVFHMKSHFPSIYLWVKQPLHRGAVRNFASAKRSKYVVVGYPYQHIGRLEAIHTPYVTVKDGRIYAGKPKELANMLTSIKQELDKKGIVISHKCPDPSIPKDRSHETKHINTQLLLTIIRDIPGLDLSPNMPSVRTARSLGLDHICENVVVEYRVLDINLQDTSICGRSIVTFVRFVEHIDEGFPQMKRAVYRDESKSKTEAAISNNLNEMIALKNAIRQHEMTHGKYSKPCIKVICTMPGSLYGCVGSIHSVGNTFDEISAVFPIADYRVTLASNAAKMFENNSKIAAVVSAKTNVVWYGFKDICAMASIDTTTAMAVFHLLTTGQYHDDIGMNLVLWNEEKGCVMCLPGYTRCSEELLTDTRMSNPDTLLLGVQYSGAVLNLVSDYRDKFPELFEYFLKNDVKPNNSAKGGYRFHLNMDVVFTGTPEIIEFKTLQLLKYVKSQVFRRLKMVVGKYDCLTDEDIASISTIYDDQHAVDSSDKDSCKLVRVSHIKNLHIPSYHTGTVFMREEDITLGQCVVYINHNETVPLGTRGTVVGIYPQNADGTSVLFEVLLEKNSMGAGQLFGRCGNMRGIFVTIADIMSIYPNEPMEIDMWSAINQAHDRCNAQYISYV